MSSKKSVPVDVVSLLDRLDQVSPPSENVQPRQGATLVDRVWTLQVCVIEDHESCGFEKWKPGIAISCSDGEGSFGTGGFVTFDQCRLTEPQIARVDRFIERWDHRRQAAERRRQWREQTNVPLSISEQTPLSEEDLKEIHDRCERATPGPWVACREHHSLGTIGGPICYMDEQQDIVIGQPCDLGSTHDPVVDAEFIAGARSDVPRLLREVARLQCELKLALRPQLPFVRLNPTVAVHRPSEWPGKPRDWSRDSIPGDVGEWMERPAAVEQAFRRGFVQGAAQVVHALQEGVTPETLESWVYGALWEWRYEDPQRCVIPPRTPSSAKRTKTGRQCPSGGTGRLWLCGNS